MINCAVEKNLKRIASNDGGVIAEKTKLHKYILIFKNTQGFLCRKS